jgi:tetraacyldisaccharide 4'-kinase
MSLLETDPLRSEWFDVVSGARRGAGAAFARGVLRALSVPYAVATGARRWLYDAGIVGSARAAVPVLSVGNITVGGTGKTPLVEHLARRLVSRGRRPAVVMRGYGASAAGGSDEATLLRANLGDGVAVVENPNRFEGVQTAARESGADVAVLDDGFQHLALARDLDIVALDATSPFGFGRLLPAGCLREGPAALARAHVIVITRADLPPEADVAELRAHVGRLAPAAGVAESVYAPARLEPLSGEAGPALADLANLDGARAAAFCGIGNPYVFGMTIRRLGARLVYSKRFADHHPFSGGELADVAREAGARRADVVLTTQKDAARIPRGAWPDGSPPLCVLRAEFAFRDGEREFWKAVAGAIAPPADRTPEAVARDGPINGDPGEDRDAAASK